MRNSVYFAGFFRHINVIYVIMDDLDKKLLTLLGNDARISVATLARNLSVARTTVQARIERLERQKIIAGYTVKLGKNIRAGHIRATVLLQIEPRANAAVLARLKSLPQVEIVHTCSGRFDLILQVVAQTTTELDSTIDNIGEITGVIKSESLIQLATKIDRAL